MPNRSKIQIICRNQEKIINKISKNVSIYNYKRQNDKYSEFEVDTKNKKNVQKFLKENNVEFELSGEKGYLNKIKKLLSSIGLICGIVLVCLIYSLQYFFVWKIEVNGIENNEEVERFIENNLSSKLKSRIDVKDIEILVKKSFDEVSSISVAIVGQSIVVNINEMVLPKEMTGNFLPLVSVEDGQITQINLIEGTLNCKVGDIVQKGDILVYPYVIDSQGQKREVSPKAEIYADVWLSETISHYDYCLKRERSGKKIVNSQVLLYDKVVYNNKKDVSFNDYEVEVEEEYLTKNLILPLKLKKTTYYEMSTFEVSQPFYEYKDEIIENTRLKALQFLKKNEIIKSENFSVNEEPNVSRVTYTITVTRNIGGII